MLASLWRRPHDDAWCHRCGVRRFMLWRGTVFFFTVIVLFAGFGLFDGGRLNAQQESVVVGTEFGEPIQGITAKEFELFRLGLSDFTEVESPDDGLGPVFNGRSCAECHSIPRIGGSRPLTAVPAGIRKDDGSFQEYPGGSVMQMFSIAPHETQVIIPPEINVIAHRKSLPLFGSGLIEAVPDAVLIALEDPDDRDADGISGRAHRVHDKASDKTRIGRFGWKAQQA